MLVIEVVMGHDRPEVRKFGEREVFETKAYMYNGGAFPQQIKTTSDSLAGCLDVGLYELLTSSFKAGKYGDIEIDRYNMHFRKLDQQETQQFKKAA